MMSMTDQDLYNLKYIKMQKRNFAKETMQRKVYYRQCKQCFEIKLAFFSIERPLFKTLLHQ